MKHFGEVLMTLGGIDVQLRGEASDWDFWEATYHTPVSNVTAYYLYLKYKCPLKEATPTNQSHWMSLSKAQGYQVIVTPRSALGANLTQTKTSFRAKSIHTAKQLLVDNLLQGFIWKKTGSDDYFIEPALQLEDGTEAPLAINYLMRWVEGSQRSTKNSPLAVMIADGGIGKTTVSRYLCDTLYKRDQTAIPILVESDLWRNLLQTNFSMQTVWDSAVSRRFDRTGRILANTTAFKVLVREGVFVVIFDGFDELCVAPGAQFRPRDVVNDLLQMVTPEDEGQQAKIILTSRTTYWQSIVDEVDVSKIEVFRLKGFDNDQRKRYFGKRLSNPSDRDVALRISKQIGGGIYNELAKDETNANRLSGAPFILDLIARYVDGNSDAAINPYTSDPLENLLLDVCKRENHRQSLGIEPQVQFEIFQELFREHSETIPLDELKLFLEMVGGVTDTSVIQRFTNHVFLAPVGEAFSPRYEVLRVYFIARFLALALSQVKGKGERATIARLLARHKTGQTQVIEWLVLQLKRLQKSDPNKLLAAIHHAVDIINDKENRESQKPAAMALFHLANNLVSSDDKKERLIQMAGFLITGTQNKKIRFENIGFTGILRAFDFSNVEFVRCWFEDVEFRNCIFSDQSAFLSCSFDGTLSFASCDGLKKFAVHEVVCSREAEYVFDEVRGTGIKAATKRAFAEEALGKALRKFKGDFGFDHIQFRYRKGGFKAGNPYNDKIWEALIHSGVIQKHRISNVDEGGLNIADDKEVRREIAYFFDNGVLGKRLEQVVNELIK